MTRQPHDQFAKLYLEELLTPFGKVEISKEVSDEARFIDVMFSPIPSPDQDLESLGVLGKIITDDSLLEAFRNPPEMLEILNCVHKLLSEYRKLQRKAKRDNIPLLVESLPCLWILATSVSASQIEIFEAKLDLDNWLPGVYWLTQPFKTALVSINQLPVTDETLWLRVLGRGAVQQQAINELVALPRENQLRQNVLQLISSWRIAVIDQENLNEDDQELIMNLSPAYLKDRAQAVEEGVQQGLQQGVQQGVQQGQRLVVESLLADKFGSEDVELSRIIDALLQLPPREYTRLCLQLSRDELLVRFGS